VAQGVFEMQGALPGLRGWGKLAQIGDLGQVEAGQVVDQVCNVGGAGRRRVVFRAIWRSVLACKS
jgi:hypothetical protein